MVMKVGNINPIIYRGLNTPKKSSELGVTNPQIEALNSVTPDYSVQIPQKYTKLGITKLPSGLEIHSYKLANGYRVNVVPMEGSPAVVKNYVNVGSMNETDNIKGISHFLEHMAFNGTIGNNGYIKLDTGDSFTEIEKMGGWTNASTSYALTDYVNSTPMLEEKDLETQIKIIAAMTENLALTTEMIEKEKGPVCSEINMILDNPTTTLIDQSVRTLFNIKSSADELIGGSTKHIKNLTREHVKEYYDKYYTPDNMNLVVTGDVNPEEVIELVSKNFHSTKTSSGKFYEEKLTPINKTIRKDFISDKTKSTQIMLSFAGPSISDVKENIILDIVDKYLSSTKFGLKTILQDYNSSGDFGNDKISTNKNNPILLSYNISTNEANSEKILKAVFDKFSNIPQISEEQLSNIKESILKKYHNFLEHSGYVNYLIGNGVFDSSIQDIANYEKILSEITTEDVKNVIDKYLDLNKVAVVLMHPETTSDKIKENHKIASKLSFQGKRKPLNTEKVHQETLDNNYRIAFYETPTDNTYFKIKLNYPINKDYKPGVVEVFNEIIDLGTKNKTKTEFDLYQENNNLDLFYYVTNNSFFINGSSTNKNFDKTLDLAKEVLYEPAITQKNLNTAISNLKEYYEKQEDNSHNLFIDNEAKTNPYINSKEDILNNLDNITLNDIQNFYNDIIQNSNGTIIMNVPQDTKDYEPYKKAYKDLLKVKPYKYEFPDLYIENTKTQVLTKEKNVSQADISQTFKFKASDDIKEVLSLHLLNTLLSSSSIGLFKTLREKEHLAYSVYSDINHKGTFGTLSCNILTTTDNKNIGEISYDNVQKSITGFNRQIEAIKNSEFTDEDFESAKRMLKADLLDKEGTTTKLAAIVKGLNSPYGIELENLLFNEIDNITRDDIKQITNKVFKTPPIYSIVASKDTLNANKDFFETL